MIDLKMLPLPVGTALVPGGVQPLTLHVERGETLWVTGPSESGKTALLETIALRRPVTGGTMSLMKHDAGTRINTKTRRTLQQRISYIEASPTFMDRLTVADNIALPLELNHVRSADMKRETDSIIRWFQLENHATALPDTLSHTTRLRVACARALITQPSIILVDEPALTLCLTLQDRLLATIRGLTKNGATALLATQTVPEHPLLPGQVISLPQVSPPPADASASDTGLAAPLFLAPHDKGLLP